jgi:hypothetical protein
MISPLRARVGGYARLYSHGADYGRARTRDDYDRGALWPRALEVGYIGVAFLADRPRRCGLGSPHLLSAAYAPLSLSRLRGQASPSCELPAPPVWCTLCYIYMHQSCCNGELSAS